MALDAELIPVLSSSQSLSPAAEPMRRRRLASGAQLKAARMLAGLSQEQLAAETGRSLRSITGWESTTGTVPCASQKSLEKVEAALRRHGVALYVTPAGGYGVEKAPERLPERADTLRQKARAANAGR
jgi:transcriptional regulator with XRE-family HTH domain